jgi:hypothetical protein
VGSVKQSIGRKTHMATAETLAGTLAETVQRPLFNKEREEFP